MTQTIAPHGSWKSPITPSLITASGVSLSELAFSAGNVYWLENRPREEGRGVVVVCLPDGTTRDVTPGGFNVRTRVHEYGGGAYCVHGDTVFFSNFADQRLYRQDPGLEPRALTPEPDAAAALRYADGRLTADGRWLICVRETHVKGGEAVNEIVRVPTSDSGPPQAIASGRDFYSFPRPSPDGRRLLWTAWDHPLMPWDGCELWIADLEDDGSLRSARPVAGGPEESIFQPCWSPDGTPHFVSDRSGWWNLYAERDGGVVPLAPTDGEFGGPQWVFGLSRYTFLDDSRIVCSCIKDGADKLGIIRPGANRIEFLETPYTSHVQGGYFQSAGGTRILFMGGSPSQPAAVVSLDIDSGRTQVLRRSVDVEVDPGYISEPRPIEFPTENDLTAFALYYPPANKDFAAPAGEKPPLLVLSHGGPTGATSSELRLGVQFWTSRGFAVVDVNYSGSTGHGRAYRERLKGQWGVADTDDCINAARYLERRGEVDGKRLAIRGGSAGGYTTLCALVFHDTFAAGASYYGVADLAALTRDTHKFESRYLDGLIGLYPEAEEVYRQRSPLSFADRLSCPVILFQGLEDKVVPPAQAEAMVEALRAKGLPYAYLSFEGEQHGFRRAANMERCLEAELYFYSRLFGFHPADEMEPVEIENL